MMGHIRNFSASVPVQLLASQLIIAATALLINVFSARALGPDVRGQLAFFMQICYVLNSACLLGRHRSFLRAHAVSSATLTASLHQLRLLTRLPTVLALLFSVVIALVVVGPGGALSLLSLGIFLLILSGIQQKTHRTAAIVARDAITYTVSTVIGQCLLLVIALYLAITGVTDLYIWLVAYGSAIALPYAIVDAHNYVQIRNTGSSLQPESRDAAKYGLKLVPTTIAEMVASRANRFLLPALSSFAQLGIFTVVVTITELIAWPVRNYTDSKVPQWTSAIREGSFDSLREAGKVIGMATAIAAPLFLLLEIFLVRIFGPEYVAGEQLILPLIIASIFQAFTSFGTGVSLAAHFTVLVNCIPIMGTLVSIALCLVWVPEHGALGAAWASVAGYGLACLPSLGVVIRLRAARND